jgi:predicted amidohydrolase YtcJ
MVHAQKKQADLLVYNGTIYTVDDQFSVRDAMVINEGKIAAIGQAGQLRKSFVFKDELDAKKQYIYPGFIDAHAHFLEYGLGLQSVDLNGTRSWEEVLNKLVKYAYSNPYGWIIGRGWDQNDWVVKEFPTREKLDQLFPGRSVFLSRVDGHAAIANAHALGTLKPGTQVPGGEIGVQDGKLTGILLDNAVELVASKIPSPTTKQKKEALLKAAANCFAAGLTTIDDCGLSYDDVLAIEELQKGKMLKMRLFVMLSDDEKNYKQIFKRGKIKTDRLNVSAFKVYADGALGSRGACLLEPYADKAGSVGFLLRNRAHYEEIAKTIFEKDFQMCTHALGDSGNRLILKTYGSLLKGKNDRRWRIEHAQVVNKNDFNWFGQYSIIPSVQPTHATSDMYWATERLGAERVKGAYAYKQLLNQNGWMPLGTDFPVEDISPLKTFYAACIRKDAKGWPAGGYQMNNALSRKEALRGMTIWAARSNFEEKEKGSLEPGKFADFIILNTDLLNADPSKLLKAQVLQTFVNGERVF